MSIKEKIVEENAEHLFTKDEMLNMSKVLTDKLINRKSLQETRSILMKQYTNDINILTCEIDNITNKLNSGKEYRIMECKAHYDFAKNNKIIYHPETTEIIKESTISSEERQEKMSFIKEFA